MIGLVITNSKVVSNSKQDGTMALIPPITEAKRWIGEFEKVYNSTHVDMPENIVLSELVEVETAMRRVAAELNQALDHVRMRADRWFRGEPEPETESTPSSSTGADSSAKTGPEEPAPVGDVQEEASTIPAPETSTPGVAQGHQEL